MTAERPVNQGVERIKVNQVATNLNDGNSLATDIDSPLSPVSDPNRSVVKGTRFTPAEWTQARGIMNAYGHSTLAPFVRALFQVLARGGRIISPADAAILDQAKAQMMGDNNQATGENSPKN